MKEKSEEAKNNYSSIYPRVRMTSDLKSPPYESTVFVGSEILKVIKKEDLTYEEAYASLQYAYDALRYESNFVKVPDEQLADQ